MSIEIQNAVEDAILEQSSFENWAANADSRYGYGSPLSARTPFGVVTVDNDGSKLTRTDATYYDGEWSQGSEEEVFILFRVDGDDTLFFKKFGTADSYGHASFNGRFRQVFPKQKMVVVYDYE